MNNTKDNIAADFLDATADELDRNGWCRGRYRSENGAHCVTGAMHAVDWQFEAGTFIYLHAQNALYNDLADEGPSIINWNDRQKDKRYVTRRLRRVARLLRGAKR